MLWARRIAGGGPIAPPNRGNRGNPSRSRGNQSLWSQIKEKPMTVWVRRSMVFSLDWHARFSGVGWGWVCLGASRINLLSGSTRTWGGPLVLWVRRALRVMSFGQDLSGACDAKTGGGRHGYAATYEAMSDIYEWVKWSVESWQAKPCPNICKRIISVRIYHPL